MFEDSDSAVDFPCEWDNDGKYKDTSLGEEIRKIQYLTGLRNFTARDVLKSTQQMHKNGLPFFLSREDFHDCFTWIRQQLGYDSDLVNFPYAVNVLNLMFNVFDKDEDNRMTVFEFAIGLAILCGGSFKDNFRTAFELVSKAGKEGTRGKRQKRFIATKYAYDAYCTIFRLLYQLYDDILQRVGCDPDYYARALTLRAFHRHSKHHRKHHRRHRHFHKHGKYKHTKDKKKFRSRIKLSSFIHWLRIGIDHIITDVPMLVEDHYNGGGLHVEKDVIHDSGGHHHSMISMTDAIRILGLHKFTPNMVVQYVTDLCDEDGTLNEATLHQGLIKLIRKHYVSLPLMERPLADHILQRLYVVCKVRNTSMCTFTDITCALLVFCGGSIRAKAKAAFFLFSVNDESLGEGITHEGICSCLTAIFKIVSDLDPGHHFSSAASCSDIAAQLANDIFVQNPQYRFADSASPRGLMPLEAFAVVFSQIMMKFDANIGSKTGNQAGDEEEDSGDSDASVHSNSSDEYMAKLTRQRSRDSTRSDGDASPSLVSLNDMSSTGANSDADSSEYSQSQGASDAAVDGTSVHRLHEHVYAEEDESIASGPVPTMDETEHLIAELQQARLILQLNGLSCHDILDVLSEFSTSSGTSLNNQVSLSSWLMVISYFSKLNSASNREFVAASQLAQRIFSAMTSCSASIGAPVQSSEGRNGGKFIPYVHMAIGVALALCENQSSPMQNAHEDKLQMAFTLLDSDNDDHLDLHELNQLIMCCLVVVQVCSPTAANKITRSGQDIHSLGAHLLAVIFEPLTNEKGLVSFDDLREFVKRAFGTFDM